MKKKLAIFAIIMIIFCTGIVIYKNRINLSKEQINIKKQELSNGIYLKVYSYENNILKGTIVVSENDSGLKKIVYPNEESEVECHGKKQVSIDYIMKKGESYIFTAENINGEKMEKTFLIDDNYIQKELMPANITYDDNNDFGKLKIEFEKFFDNNIKMYIKFGKRDWEQINSNIIDIDMYEMYGRGLIDKDKNLEISVKQTDKNGNNIVVDKLIQTNNIEEISILSAEDLNKSVEMINQSGYYYLFVKDERYLINVTYYDSDLNIESDTEIGNQIDVANDKRDAIAMEVLKVNGKITINENANLTTAKSDAGYGGPKGFYINCLEIENNGTITMTAKGAKADGQNVYLWSKSDENYEYVPALGANGISISVSNKPNGWFKNGNNGENGNLRMTRRRRLWKYWLWN